MGRVEAVRVGSIASRTQNDVGLRSACRSSQTVSAPGHTTQTRTHLNLVKLVTILPRIRLIQARIPDQPAPVDGHLPGRTRGDRRGLKVLVNGDMSGRVALEDLGAADGGGGFGLVLGGFGWSGEEVGRGRFGVGRIF